MINKDFLKALFLQAEYYLKERGIKGEILLFGGSAIIFAFSDRLYTKDIDAYFAPKEEVIDALKKAAKELGFFPETSDWLNSAVLRYIYARPPRELQVVYDGKYLQVFVPTMEYLLAMKLFAAREEKDLDDVLIIAKHLNIKTKEELITVFRKVFPENYLDEKRLGFINEAANILQRNSDDPKTCPTS